MILKLSGRFDLSRGIKNTTWTTAFDEIADVIIKLGYFYDLKNVGCQAKLDCVYKQLYINGASEKALNYIKVVKTILENSSKFVKTEDTNDVVEFKEF